MQRSLGSRVIGVKNKKRERPTKARARMVVKLGSVESTVIVYND